MLRWKDVLYYAKYGNPEPPRRVEKTAAEWQALLTPAQFRVLRQQATEPPYRNAYCRSYEPGVYACAGCGSLLFDSATKYHAMSGWPSFTQPLAKNAIHYAFDDSHHMQRIEASCNVCGSHLGHVFPDGPEPSGLRYCMNSESLVRQEEIARLVRGRELIFDAAPVEKQARYVTVTSDCKSHLGATCARNTS